MKAYALLLLAGLAPAGAPARAKHEEAPGPATDCATATYPIGHGVSSPVLLYKREPEYTKEARKALVQGTVLLYAEVGTDGYAHCFRVARGLGWGLDENAMKAVAKWKWRPGLKDGQPVTVTVTVEANYRLL